MLSIQALRGLPRLRAPDIVACIISFSRQFPCFLVVLPQHASFRHRGGQIKLDNRHAVSEQFLNGTSAHYRLFSAINGG